MLPSSKLNFAAWTGLGITALFGGTGIYLVRNSQNFGRGEDKKDQAKTNSEQGQDAKNSLPKLDFASEPNSPKEQQVTSDPNLSPESEPLENESDPSETDSSPEETSPENLDSQETEDVKEVKQEREDEDKNSDIVHLTLGEEEEFNPSF